MAVLHRRSGCDNKDRVADIIFVHGLNPKEPDTKKFAFETWGVTQTHPDFWGDWLYNDLKGIEDNSMPVGIWVLEYDSLASSWFGTTMPLPTRAGNVLDLMWGEELNEKPVVFICHSMGGLVVKELLRRGTSDGVTKWEPIVKDVCGVAFLSTPHSGADFATFIQALKTTFRLTVSITDLSANSAQLLALSTWYKNNAEKLNIATIAYGENKETNGVLVVNQTSANPQIQGSDVVMLDKDHSGVAKPVSRGDQPYKSLLRFTRESILAAQKRAEEAKKPPFPFGGQNDNLPNVQLFRM